VDFYCENCIMRTSYKKWPCKFRNWFYSIPHSI
jgi:hypothetical protein